MEVVGSLGKIGISRGASIAAPAEAVQFNVLLSFHSKVLSIGRARKSCKEMLRREEILVPQTCRRSSTSPLLDPARKDFLDKHGVDGYN